jgi:hypothetical protein
MVLLNNLKVRVKYNHALPILLHSSVMTASVVLPLTL